MMWLKAGIMVRIEQLSGDRAPVPLPLSSGFSIDKEYEIMGMWTPSESADAFAVLINDFDQIWYICTRHLRYTHS